MYQNLGAGCQCFHFTFLFFILFFIIIIYITCDLFHILSYINLLHLSNINMLSYTQVLGADLAILDEIDSGLDVDALRDVAEAVNRLLTPTNSLLMITHYARLLNSIKPTYIHVMVSHLMIFMNYVILFWV